MALAVAGTVSRSAPFLECVKFTVFNGKSLLRPQTKAFVVPSATIISKIYQEPGFMKEPWPYKEKGYTMLHYFYDKTLWRFNENTKMILVEGPIASGKTTFAKQIADDLNMCYFPQPSADMWYTNEYGWNARELNKQLPKSSWFVNKEDFYRDPNMRFATYQLAKTMQMSLMLYLDAMAHILNTGQGVVMDRGLLSNIVDITALVDTGYVRKEFIPYYNDCFFYILRHVIKPHLVIYLDIPVETCQERIKKRGIDYELDTPVLSKQYLSSMEKCYKEHLLPELSVHAEMLVYDWTNFGDAEVVVEDIERINFDKYTDYDAKLSDWRIERERQWGITRNMCTSNRSPLTTLWNQPHAQIPELFVSHEDWYRQADLRYQHPTEKYAVGYNAEAGDKGIWWKVKSYGWRFSGGGD